jgi:phosphate:Na+ symporter
VATTLTALHTQSVSFEQACSLVIGAAIGTTVTGVLAAMGGSIPAKRTAMAHVLFNLATGILAIVALPVLLRLVGWAQTHLGLEEGAMSLAAFHSFFIALGVLVFLPFLGAYARWIERLLPDAGPGLTRHLDASVMAVPAVALEMTRRALRDSASAMFAHFGSRFAPASHANAAHGRRDPAADLPSPAEVARALEDIPEFLSRIPPLSDSMLLAAEREAQIHAIDHLTRLHDYTELPEDVARVMDHSRLMQDVQACRDILQAARDFLASPSPGQLETVRAKAAAISERRRQQRALMLHETAQGRWPPNMALDLLDAMRWLDAVAYHVWRICHHLLPRNGQSDVAESASPDSAPNASPGDEPR